MESSADLLSHRDGFAEHANIASRLVSAATGSTDPVISIMIPTFQRPKLLREAVRSALAQVVDVPFEVVVVDNDPDPIGAAEVEAVIAGFEATNLQLYRNDQNIGMFGNWNRCIQLARGRWITILNDDDLLDHAFLSVVCAETSSGAGMIATRANVRDERAAWLNASLIRKAGKAVRSWLEGGIGESRRTLTTLDYFLYNPHFGSLGILFEREAALALGGFNPSLYPSADYIFFVRYFLQFGAIRKKQKLATYRVLANESRRAVVVEKWIVQGLQLRYELATRIGRCTWLLRRYAELNAIGTARTAKYSWNRSLDTKRMLKAVNLPDLPVYVVAHGTGIILRMIFALAGYPSKADSRSLASSGS